MRFKHNMHPAKAKSEFRRCCKGSLILAADIAQVQEEADGPIWTELCPTMERSAYFSYFE